MRKLFSLLLVVAMVLGLVGTAMAATSPTDVAGTSFETAVNRLAALNILGGYPDGTFKPNNNITRAEVAKIMVNAMGLGTAADAAKGATKFKDVPATHWASGFINLAVSRGIIVGYPDGTFKPEANVSNAEAMAMLIRVLGYDPSVVGTWPMNYVSKAAEIGLTEGLSLVPEVPAIRGNVAEMTSTGLTVDMMVQEYYGQLNSYKVQAGVNLLNSRLGVTELKKAIVYATPNYARQALSANQVKIQDKDGAFHTYTFSGVDVEALLGHMVTVWVKNSEVFNIIDTTPADRIVSFTNTTADGGNTIITNTKGTTTLLDDVTYSLLKDAGTVKTVAYFNHANETYLNTDIAGSSVTLFLDDNNKVRFVTALKYQNSGVVSKVTAAGATPAIEYYTTGLSAKTTANLNTTPVYTFVDANGAKMALADVKVGDVISLATNGTELWGRIVRNSVTGTVSKVADNGAGSTSAYKNWTLTIGDATYKVALNAYLIGTDGKTSTAIQSNDEIRGLIGYTGTFYLDVNGAIRVATGTAPATAANQAFVLNNGYTGITSEGVGDFIKVLKVDGTIGTMPIDASATGLKETYTLKINTATGAGTVKVDGEDVVLAAGDIVTPSAAAAKIRAHAFANWTTSGTGDTVVFTAKAYGNVTDAVAFDDNTATVTVTETPYQGLAVGEFVKFALNDKNYITSATRMTAVDDPAEVTNTVNATTSAVDDTYDRITVGGSTFVVTSDTKVFQVNGSSTAVSSWSAIENSTDTALNITVYPVKGFVGRANYIVVNSGTIGAPTNTGVALVEKYVDTKGVYHAVVLVDGASTDYKVSSSVKSTYDSWKYGEVASLTYDSDKYITGITKDTYEELPIATVDQIGKTVVFESATWFGTKDTVVFDFRNDLAKSDFSAVSEGQLVDVYLTGTTIDYIVIQADPKYTEIAGLTVSALVTADDTFTANGKSWDYTDMEYCVFNASGVSYTTNGDIDTAMGTATSVDIYVNADGNMVFMVIR